MKFAYKFSNLMGTIYRKGNVVFTPDGNSVISPVGNKITIYNLKTNTSKTLSLQSNFNYTAIDISPNGCLLLAVNERGEAQLISLISHTVIHTYKFSSAALCVKFSPDGSHFAAAKENMVFVFKSPGEITGEYGGFVLRRYFFGAHDDCVWIDWSSDSRFLVVGSRDSSTKVYGVELYENFRPYLLGGHTDALVGCFFEADSMDVNTVSRNGQLCQWQCSVDPSEIVPMAVAAIEAEPKAKRTKNEDDEAANDDDDDLDPANVLEQTAQELEKELLAAEFTAAAGGTGADEQRDAHGQLVPDAKKHPFFYTRTARHYLMNDIKRDNRNACLTACTYHKHTKLLITAYSTGAFYLHELPDVSLIHSLSISDHSISTACFNSTGDWIALGASGLGQLLVWEWQSEQYVMKQQGHASEMSCIAYSPDGRYIVTGGVDAKVKLWTVQSGFCFVTFGEHTAAVTAVEFSATRKFVVSASLDGTVRAYDMTRYRNFRTFTSPRPVQFGSVAVDYSGELVVAGGQDVFEIYLWSMKFGRLLEVLSGHEGPVVALAFAPLATSTTLVSGSWDRTVKVWNALESCAEHETIDVQADVTALAFKPNGEEVAVTTLNGSIQVFGVRDSVQLASIEGRADLGSGVSETDLITAKKNLQAKCFTTIAWSADGKSVLAGGKSKNVCIYQVEDRMLLKKFEITQNHSLDGLDEFINRRNLTEFGNMALIEERDQLEGGTVAVRLPGVQKGDMAARNHKPEVRVYAVRFSPSAQSWAAATTEGLLVFSLDKGIVFDPFNLTLEVTPKTIRQRAAAGESSTALLMALRLNEQQLVQEVLEGIPHGEVNLVAATLPDEYAHRTLQFVAKQLESTQHVEFYLRWSSQLLTSHGPKEDILSAHTLLALHQNLSRKYEQLSKVCDFNKYTMRVLRSIEVVDEEAKKTDDDGDEAADDSSSDADADDAMDGDGGLLLLRKVRADEDADATMESDSDDADSASEED